jgi:DNA-directed RNA polymerase subunit RPC12/RpoP
MAIEIVGENESAKRRATCRKCGAVLEYLPVDVKVREVGDYSGEINTVYSIECPRCKGRIYVKGDW